MLNILIDNQDLPVFKEYFGKQLTVLNKCYCDITHSEKTRVEFPCAGKEDAFFIGRLIQNEIIFKIAKWKTI